jgi:hypothetical protein
MLTNIVGVPPEPEHLPLCAGRGMFFGAAGSLVLSSRGP